MTTEIIDKLFLELSQFTSAQTQKELELKEGLKNLHDTIIQNQVYTEDMQVKVRNLLTK